MNFITANMPGRGERDLCQGIGEARQRGATKRLATSGCDERRGDVGCERSGADLAFGAEAEEFQFVGNLLKSVLTGHLSFEFSRDAIIDLDDPRTPAADEVMMMAPPRLVLSDLESRAAIAEVDALDHAQFFEARQGTIDGREIAVLRGEGLGDLLRCQRARLVAKDFEDDLARAGDPSRSAAQALFPIVGMRAGVRRGLRMRFHGRTHPNLAWLHRISSFVDSSRALPLGASTVKRHKAARAPRKYCLREG